MIEFSHVYKTYPGPIHALKNINLSIEKGEFIYITGSSGAGKTTLFRLMSAYDKPTSGKVSVAGYDLDEISEDDVPFYRRKIGVVFQDFRLLNGYTIVENIALPLKVLGHKSQYINKKVEEILELVGLTHRLNFYPHQISGGEKQRTAIARALIHHPEVLIADEPTGNLDPELSLEIIKIFENINAQGTTIFVATHDINIVDKSDKKRLHINNGIIGTA